MRRTFASASFFCTFASGIVIFFFHEFFRSVLCAERFFLLHLQRDCHT